MSRYKIAITGGIGSGKSTVGRILASQGYPVYSCDEISKDLYQTEEYQKGLLALFPFCESNGTIDRKKLATLVFSDEASLQSLNAYAHPQIMKRLFKAIENEPSDVCFAEVPLLFEGGYENNFSFVMVVERGLELRIQSIIERDHITKEEALQRIRRQWDYSGVAHQKMMQGKHMLSIQNNNDEHALKNAVIKTLSFLLNNMQ